MTEQRLCHLQVEPDSEITSVLRALRSIPHRRVALHLPENPRIFRDTVNLRLLLAYAREAGKEIALVSLDEGVVQAASAYGPAVFASAEDVFVSESLRPPEEEAATAAGRPRRLLYAAAFAVLVCLAGLALFTPRAVVELAPVIRPISLAVEFPLGGAGEGGAPVERIVVQAEAEIEVETTGIRSLGVEPARGIAVFLNEGREPVFVPAGTVVSTSDGIEFLTVDDTMVPPLQPERFLDLVVGLQAGVAEVGVQAASPGQAGNVAAGRIRLVDGFGDSLQVRNPEPTHGGRDRTVRFVSEEDAARLRALAQERLRIEAERRAAEGLGDRWWLVEGSLRLTETEQIVVDPPVGAEAQWARAKAAGSFEAQVVQAAWLVEAAEAKLLDSMPEGFALAAGPWVSGRSFVLRSDGAAARLEVKADLQARLDARKVAGALAGLKTEEALKLLESSEQVASARITPSSGRLPSWRPWISVKLRPAPIAQAGQAGWTRP